MKPLIPSFSAIAGNLPDFDEATRALFADDAARFAEQSAAWPADIRNYACQLAFYPKESQQDVGAA